MPDSLSNTSPINITKNKLVLAEGRDAELFLVWACRAYQPDKDIQVMDFGGIKDLPNYLLLLKDREYFDKVDTLVIARDAETNVESAAKSIQGALKNAGLPVPQKPFQFTSKGSLKTAFMIFPGPKYDKGTLEDLCLLTVENDSSMDCVDGFLDCVKSKGEILPRCHKNKLHCFLSGKDKFVGSTIGQASYKKAWPPDHSALEPFNMIIKSM